MYMSMQHIWVYLGGCFIKDVQELIKVLFQILEYEKLSSVPAQRAKAKALYDKFIYADMLAMDSVCYFNQTTTSY